MVTPRPDPPDPFADLLDALAATQPDWFRGAACLGSALDFTETKAPGNVVACLQICGGCNVRRSCLAWAVDAGDAVAVLGGTDPAARKPLIRERRRQVAEAQRRADDERNADTDTDDTDDADEVAGW